MPSGPPQQIVRICHLLAEHGYTSATGGNVSVRAADGTFWVTPSRLHKARVRVDDLVRIDADMRIVQGTRPASSESLMHLAVYDALPQAQAVVHAHPPAATGFALARRPIDTRSSSEAVAILGPRVPLIGYARPSTTDLARLVGESMCPRHKAYLMANHGAITWGVDLWDAYDMLDTLEFIARSIVAAASLGGAVPLSRSELAWLERKASNVSSPLGRGTVETKPPRG